MERERRIDAMDMIFGKTQQLGNELTMAFMYGEWRENDGRYGTINIAEGKFVY